MAIISLVLASISAMARQSSWSLGFFCSKFRYYISN